MKTIIVGIFMMCTITDTFALGNCQQYLAIRTGAFKDQVDKMTTNYLNGVLDGAAIVKMWSKDTFVPIGYNRDDNELISFAVNTCLENPKMDMMQIGAKFLSIKIKNNDLIKY